MVTEVAYMMIRNHSTHVTKENIYVGFAHN